MNETPPTPRVKLAVVGAHLTGQPLNHQLTSRSAALVRTCRTAPVYRFYALPGTVPPKPGLIRVARGAAIEVEVWEMSAEAFGTFVAAIPPPMAIGTLQLQDGELVKGFLCEPYAVEGATDISSFGGWRNYLAAAK
jgi:allophanate hydrolase